jgi:hypothetical protein
MNVQVVINCYMFVIFADLFSVVFNVDRKSYLSVSRIIRPVPHYLQTILYVIL